MILQNNLKNKMGRWFPKHRSAVDFNPGLLVSVERKIRITRQPDIEWDPALGSRLS